MQDFRNMPPKTLVCGERTYKDLELRGYTPPEGYRLLESMCGEHYALIATGNEPKIIFELVMYSNDESSGGKKPLKEYVPWVTSSFEHTAAANRSQLSNPLIKHILKKCDLLISYPYQFEECRMFWGARISWALETGGCHVYSATSVRVLTEIGDWDSFFPYLFEQLTSRARHNTQFIITAE